MQANMYDNALLVTAIAVATFAVFKIIQYVKRYLEWIRICRKIHGHPTHWLFGNLDRVKTSLDYVMYPLELVQKQRTRLYRMWLGLEPIFGVCHPDSAKVILRSSEPKAAYAASDPYRMMIPWLGHGLTISDGAKWERNRRLITPAFHFGILQKYTSVFNQTADIMLDKMKHTANTSEFIDIFPCISRATLDSIMRCAHSYKGEFQADSNKAHPYVTAVCKTAELVLKRMINPLVFSDLIYRFTGNGRLNAKLCNYLHEFTENVISTRKATLSENENIGPKGKIDFLDILLTAKDENGVGLTPAEVREEVDTFMFAGHDTTASAISWAIYALGRYPEEQDKVHKEVTRILGDRHGVEGDDLQRFSDLTCFIKETMRFYSPVPLISRRLTKPCMIDGVELPAGSRMDINIYCIHHHPDVWPDHMEFRPERFIKDNAVGKDPFGFVPFSAGPRNCIGQNFAMNEIKVFLSKIIQTYEVHVDKTKEPTFQPEIIMRSSDGINVSLTLRR